ncbi:MULTISPECIES: glycosyltransferase family 2 protein [Actinopolyspora]|uniref:Glycosyltransferase, GT2 family n=1 Tax=Actinopolyspora saharensis TaxID=995062 RepID=A0A1H0ZG83_9ACTN|nr:MULTISPECIES: glycosyltransferase [Actinopolyspora]NHD15811.1 glycosyltransferase [Actinopolyspora sp. BKK2]NHE74975.1 glycosyltransferase [Actinopolyspora sp. BKK1]SDQ26349.1 Glycosyltransferase, GT2 family [Actinopolyspora saharensis]
MRGEQRSDRVTVVIATRNRREELSRTLRHMTSLEDAAPVIVVDNGSTDGTAEAVTARFPEVCLLRSESNLGAVARDVAVEYAGTPLVAFCDDDMRWQSGSLTRAATLLERCPPLGAVVARCVVEPDLVDDPLTPELRDSPVPAPPWLPGPAVLGGLAGTMVVRVEAFRAVGGFSERLWFGGEEELLLIDMAARGWWACYAEDAVVRHRPSAVREPAERRRIGLRNTLWTTWLRRSVGGALRRSGAVLASAPKDRVTASAVLGALGGLPWLLREREAVPAGVEQALTRLEAPQRRSAARDYVG